MCIKYNDTYTNLNAKKKVKKQLTGNGRTSTRFWLWQVWLQVPISIPGQVPLGLFIKAEQSLGCQNHEIIFHQLLFWNNTIISMPNVEHIFDQVLDRSFTSHCLWQIYHRCGCYRNLPMICSFPVNPCNL